MNFYYIKRDLFGTIIYKISFGKAIKYIRKGKKVLNLDDTKLQELIEKEKAEGKKVEVIKVKSKPFVLYPTKEEMQQMREEEEIEEEIKEYYEKCSKMQHTNEEELEYSRKTISEF